MFPTVFTNSFPPFDFIKFGANRWTMQPDTRFETFEHWTFESLQILSEIPDQIALAFVIHRLTQTVLYQNTHNIFNTPTWYAMQPRCNCNQAEELDGVHHSLTRSFMMWDEEVTNFYTTTQKEPLLFLSA